MWPHVHNSSTGSVTFYGLSDEFGVILGRSSPARHADSAEAPPSRPENGGEPLQSSASDSDHHGGPWSVPHRGGRGAGSSRRAHAAGSDHHEPVRPFHPLRTHRGRLVRRPGRAAQRRPDRHHRRPRAQRGPQPRGRPAPLPRRARGRRGGRALRRRHYRGRRRGSSRRPTSCSRPARARATRSPCGFAAATGDIIVMFDADGSADARRDHGLRPALAAGCRLREGQPRSSHERRQRGHHPAPRRWATVPRPITDNLLVPHPVHRPLLRLQRVLASTCLPHLGPSRPGRGPSQVWGDGFEIETLHQLPRLPRPSLRIVEVASVELARIFGESNLNAGPRRLARAAHDPRRAAGVRGRTPRRDRPAADVMDVTRPRRPRWPSRRGRRARSRPDAPIGPARIERRRHSAPLRCPTPPRPGRRRRAGASPPASATTPAG